MTYKFGIALAVIVLFSSGAVFAQEPTGTGTSTVAPGTANELATPSPRPASTAGVPAEPKACLIVASAEGHRFRDSMIAGALTGGIGFAAGAFAGGAKYAYRDSFNLPAKDVKVKYKGNQLQKIQESGVHVIVVNAKDKTDSEIDSARKSCQQQ